MPNEYAGPYVFHLKSVLTYLYKHPGLSGSKFLDTLRAEKEILYKRKEYGTGLPSNEGLIWKLRYLELAGYAYQKKEKWFPT